VREASLDVGADYRADAVLAAVAGGQRWRTLSATVEVPAATAAKNGTALQLRVTPLANAHNWGTTQPRRSRHHVISSSRARLHRHAPNDNIRP
jgi:hypothetical protein